MSIDRWIAVISLIVTTGAVFFSIWAFKRGEKKRVPTFVAALSPEILVNEIVLKFTEFALTFNGKPVGKGGISAFFVYFWNDGRLPILRSEVTSPYAINFDKKVRVLSTFIAKASRPVLGAEARVITGQERDSVELAFAVLEPGDGIKVQIIIDGPPDTQLSFSGSCLDSKKVRVLPRDSAHFVSRAKRFEQAYLPPVIVLLLAATMSSTGWLLNLFAKHLPSPLNHFLGFVVLAIFGCALLFVVSSVAVEWYKRWTATSVPPEILNP